MEIGRTKVISKSQLNAKKPKTDRVNILQVIANYKGTINPKFTKRILDSHLKSIRCMLVAEKAL